MNMRNKKLKVALVGIHPPPYGGVSIHIQRLQDLCLANNIKCVVFDVSRNIKKIKGVININHLSNWWRILFSRQDVIHAHTTSKHWKMPAIFYFLARVKGAKYMLSYHSLRYKPQDFSTIERWMMKYILSSADYLIADSPEVRDRIIDLIKHTYKLTIIPAFLPPITTQNKTNGIPQYIQDFMANHSPVITAGAFRIVFYNRQDLYGIDMCIEMCTRLKSLYPRIGVVFCLPNIGDYNYFTKLRQDIKDNGISDNFLFITEALNEVYPIWQKGDIFVRPTNSDADAISLREALYLKTPSIASDISPRPKGTVTFRNRDIDDFTDCVKTIWENYPKYKAMVNSLVIDNGGDEILTLYKSLVGNIN